MKFFESKGHRIVGSSSIVPQNDPTLLFTNAGMCQFKDVFLGADKREYTRATTAQKCLRISGKHNDLENVGVTARHHTFFEMLGNFSFGDYFKPDAIRFAWEFITEVLKLDKSRLWATVFEKDDEAAALWPELTGISPSRVVRLGEKDNFWAMGETGPCGPCSEIHYYLGENPEKQTEADLKRDDGSFLEIWNLVFMQFNRSTDGSMTPLPKPSVDTGMGLERIASIMQGVRSNYDTDLLRGIITRCEELSGYRYDGSDYEPRDLKSDLAYARDVAMRVIADHSRAIVFLIAEGVQPSSDGRGYVLRRLIRRAVRHGRVLDFKEPFLAETTKTFVKMLGGHYSELVQQQDLIARVVQAEEKKFHETLDAGLAVLQREVEKLQPGQLFPGKAAFLLHDTYGFPLDLTEDALKAYSRQVDREGFEKAMEEQRARSREDRRAQDISFQAISVEAPPTEFLGYESEEAESVLRQVVLPEGMNKASAGDPVSMIFDRTPFYAESGGQVGDTGTVTVDGAEIRITDTQKLQERYFLHIGEVRRGEVSPDLAGKQAKLKVDHERRRRIRAHHSATHLVHAALRRILGQHVKQAGSRVDERSLRFDYAHFEPVNGDQLRQVQELVNDQIQTNAPVEVRTMSLEEARQAGALAFFGEKYGKDVRVVKMGDFSKELCGGTHVSRTGDIGSLIISSDSGISAGVRRIECLAGAAAIERVLEERRALAALGEVLKSEPAQMPDRVEKLVSRTRDLEKELESLKAKLASAAGDKLLEQARLSAAGVKVVAAEVDAADTATLRSMVDRLRLKLGSGVVALASRQGDSAVLVAGVTPDLTASVHAGNLIKEASKAAGGKGGGRADFAQAGGVPAAKIEQALGKILELVG